MNEPHQVLTDPDALHDPADRQRWRASRWWDGQTLAAAVTQWCHDYRDRVAVIGLTAIDRVDHQRRHTGDYHQWTYAELDHHSQQLARKLADNGVGAHDPVLLHLPNTIEFPLALAALLRLGALPVFALHSHREKALAEMAASCGARIIVTAAEHQPLDCEHVASSCADLGIAPLSVISVDAADAAAGMPSEVANPKIDPATAGLIQLSGGTTGASKLIPRTHDGYLHSVRRSAEICGLDTHSKLLVTLPASHNFPMSSPGILGAWCAGATVVMAPDPSPGTNLTLVERHRITHLSLVPPLARAFVESARAGRRHLHSLQVIGVGGARLPESVARDVESVLGARVQQVFGMAEGLVCYTRLDDPDEVRFTTQGRPLSAGDRIRVVDELGNDCPPGQEGELHTHGPYTISRYLGCSEREQRSFTSDGWYRSGDLVIRRPDGNLVVTGRSGDRINRAGEKISATDIEDHVIDHPDVLDAIAVGVPDDRLGEQLVIAVTMREDTTTPPDLRAHLSGKGLPAHWRPDRTVALDRLPTTGVGKNSRKDLRAAVAAQLAARAQPHTTEERTSR